jgi:endonuclease YncB( thermonuclease family)
MSFAISLAAGAFMLAGAIALDGDTIITGSEHIRLAGIDAPEPGQFCADAQGIPWECGEAARAELQRLLDAAGVQCWAKGRDRYGRLLADCPALASALVSAGLALAYRRYSMEYAAAEDAAHSERRGIWAGAFVPPEQWRKDHKP